MISCRYRPGLRLLCSIGLAIAAQAVGAANGSGQTIGEAFDLQSAELLYRETHCVDLDRSTREVKYHSRDGQLLAHKLVDYSSGRSSPSFVQHNLYSKEVIEVALSEGRITMSVADADNRQAKKVGSEQPGGNLPVVIDAGFDEFIRAHWENLVAGQKKSFLFPLAARSSLIEMRVRPAACRYQTDSDSCFRLEPSNWLVRLLAAPIELGYDTERRQLTRYRGLSNIGDENGDGLVVDIRYRYPDRPASACRVDQDALNDNAGLVVVSRPDAGDS